MKIFFSQNCSIRLISSNQSTLNAKPLKNLHTLQVGGQIAVHRANGHGQYR